MSTVTLQGFAINSTTYVGSASLTLTISEGATLSYSEVPEGVTNLFGITEVDVVSSYGAYTSQFSLNGGVPIPVADEDETYIYQLNLSTGPVTVLSYFDSSTNIDYVFPISGTGSLPTNPAEFNALRASIDPTTPAQAAAAPYAPGQAIDPTAISGASVSQNDSFVGTSDGEAFDGGSGADDLDGNGGNDTLNGGSGNDTLNGGAGEDTFGYSGGADVIEDFSADFLQIDPSVLAGSFASVLSSATVVSGNLVLDFGGGNTLTLNGITDTAALDGRVQGVSTESDPESDLTGDGTSDILWRNGTTGQYGMFDMAGGTPTWSVLGQENAVWQIPFVGDFDGDGTDDILWRHDTNGFLGYSAMGSGAPVWNGIGIVSTAWEIVGVGDFTGDGTDDILWRNTGNGQVGVFEMDGGSPSWQVISNTSLDFRLVGVGDFDGDGTDDILWRHETNGGTGMFAMGSGTPTWQGFGQVSFDWDIVGVGDYNGDGTDDILWRNVNTGSVGMYDMDGGTPSWQTIGQAGLAWDVEGQFVDEFVF